MRIQELLKENWGPERYPGILPIGDYLSPDSEFADPSGKRDPSYLWQDVDQLINAGIEPQIVTTSPSTMLATQDWLSNDPGDGPLYPEYADLPVVYEKNGKYYILDGHHRTTRAKQARRPIKIYFFSDDMLKQLQEDITRRGFLQGAAGAAAAAAGGYQAAQYLNRPQTQPQVQPEPPRPTTPKDILLYTAKQAGIAGAELAQLLAQAAHETLDFSRMEERGTPQYFRTKYEDPRKARILGNKQPGDGERYKGRGFVQLTGRYNYTKAGQALGIDLVNRPELAADPATAAEIALWYWKSRVAPKVQDFTDTHAVTRRINPGMKHKDRRAEKFAQFHSEIREINAPDELRIPEDLIQRFTSAGWQILGEGRDQLVLTKPGARYVLKIVGSGNQARQQAIKDYVEVFRQRQRNPHFPRILSEKEFVWGRKKFYAYTQELLQSLPGDEAVLDYLEYAMNELSYDQEPDFNRIPPGLSVEQIEGLIYAVDDLFGAGMEASGFDLSNVANIMVRPGTKELVIVDPFSDFSELSENFADGKVKGKSRPGRVKRAGASCAGSVTDLRAKARKYGGEKGKMYHWCANMKGGKRK